MSWDAFQREALVELGHVLYCERRPDADHPPPTGTDPVAAAARLLHALGRAAGVTAAQLPAWPAIEQIRGAAAKRALWPRIRALRAGLRLP